MIITTVVYGIRLTDEFGEFNEKLSNDDIKLIKKYYQTKTIGFVDFPSEEDTQFFLGFETWVNKATDLKSFESIWNNIIKNSPKELQDLAYKLKDNGCDTEVHFVASEC
jgi:hypothetical protein